MYSTLSILFVINLVFLNSSYCTFFSSEEDTPKEAKQLVGSHLLQILGLSSDNSTEKAKEKPAETVSDEKWPYSVKIMDLEDLENLPPTGTNGHSTEAPSRWAQILKFFGLDPLDSFEDDYFGETPNNNNEGVAVFAIPGWNEAHSNVSSLGHHIYPGLLIPANYANFSGYDTNNSFAYYDPVFHNLTGHIPVGVIQSPDDIETAKYGLPSQAQESSKVNKTMDNSTLKSTTVKMEETTTEQVETTSTTQAVEETTTEMSTTPVLEEEEEEVGDEELDLERKKRSFIPINNYFNFIRELDDEKCLEQMICEVGANPKMYGSYGKKMNAFFNNLNVSEFRNINVDYYVSRFNLGKKQGLSICRRPSCRQDMSALILSIPYF